MAALETTGTTVSPLALLQVPLAALMQKGGGVATSAWL